MCSLSSNSDAAHILAGDFNFEFVKGNVGFEFFYDIVKDYNLICCDNDEDDDLSLETLFITR